MKNLQDQTYSLRDMKIRVKKNRVFKTKFTLENFREIQAEEKQKNSSP